MIFFVNVYSGCFVAPFAITVCPLEAKRTVNSRILKGMGMKSALHLLTSFCYIRHCPGGTSDRSIKQTSQKPNNAMR